MGRCLLQRIRIRDRCGRPEFCREWNPSLRPAFIGDFKDGRLRYFTIDRSAVEVLDCWSGLRSIWLRFATFFNSTNVALPWSAETLVDNSRLLPFGHSHDSRLS